MTVPFADFSDVLSGPGWSVGATVLAAVAIVVAVVLARQQRAHKVLGYDLGVTALVSVHQGARDLIKIYYGDEQIDQADLLQLRLVNAGNVPILEADFQRPLRLEFEGGGSPLTVDAKSSPDELRPKVEIVGGAVTLAPLLLNPEDSISIEVFARNFKGVHLDYRVIGVPTLTQMTSHVTPSLAQLLAESLTLASGPFTEPLRESLNVLVRRARK
jgi:hypothetical protein